MIENSFKPYLLSDRLTTLSGQLLRRVAFGAEQLGGHGWGKVDVGAIEKALFEAAEMGDIFIDTADCYGMGESERRLSSVLSSYRNRVFLSTKLGVRFNAVGKAYYDNRPAYLDAALDQSLERLGSSCVDLLQIHWPDGITPLQEVFERLERFRQEGRVRFYGVSNFPFQKISELTDEWPGFATISAQYSMVHRHNELTINRLCSEKNLVFLGWGSLAQGLLSAKYDLSTKFGDDDRRSRKQYLNFHGEKLRKNMEVVSLLCDLVSEGRAASTTQLAIRFILELLPASLAIVGVKDKAQFSENMEALNIKLDIESLKIMDSKTSWAKCL